MLCNRNIYKNILYSHSVRNHCGEPQIELMITIYLTLY